MKNSIRILGTLIAVLFLILPLFAPGATIAQDDDNPYDFDYENWEPYEGVQSGSRLPYDKDEEAWLWEPWYAHGTAVPFYQHEEYWSQEGWGIRMERIGYENLALHGGLYRQESVEPCRTYRFAMWTRAGIDPDHPTGDTTQMRVGIATDGYAPSGLIVDPDHDSIVWSTADTTKYEWEKLAVETEAMSDTVTLFTRGYASSENMPTYYWDEGEFSQIDSETLLDLGEPLPSETGGISDIGVLTYSTEAVVAWDVVFPDLSGQILYRPATSQDTEPISSTHQVYLPLIMGSGHDWQYTNIEASSNRTFSIRITGLQPDTTYEYIIISYGYFDYGCRPLVTNTTTPRRFTTKSN